MIRCLEGIIHVAIIPKCNVQVSRKSGAEHFVNP